MDDVLIAKGLLIGHDDSFVKDFISEKVYEKMDEFRPSDRYTIHSHFSDVMLELYQKTGIDMNYDNLDVYNGRLRVDLRYIDNHKTFSLDIGVNSYDR